MLKKTEEAHLSIGLYETNGARVKKRECGGRPGEFIVHEWNTSTEDLYLFDLVLPTLIPPVPF
jgi:hypothetical protein